MLKAYEAFLVQTIKPQSVPLYLKWVSDCYAFLDKPSSTRLNSEQKKQFLVHMAKRYEDCEAG